MTDPLAPAAPVEPAAEPAPLPPDATDGVEAGPDIDSDAGALPDELGTPIVDDTTPGGD